MRTIGRFVFDAPVRSIRAAPRGGAVAVVVDGPPRVELFAVRERQLVHVHTLLDRKARGDATALEAAFHPTRDELAVVGVEQRIQVWRVTDGHLLRELGELSGSDAFAARAFQGLAFSPDGQFLDTHSIERGEGERYAWGDGQRVTTRWGPGGCLALHPEGTILAVCETGGNGATTVRFACPDGAAFRWYSVVLTVPFDVGRLAFSADGGTFVVAGGTGRLYLQVHDFPSCTRRFVVDLGLTPDDLDFVPWDIPQAAAFDLQGSAVYGPSVDGQLRSWSAVNGAIMSSAEAHAGVLRALDVVPEAGLLITGGQDGSVVVMDLGQPAGASRVATHSLTNEFAQLYPSMSAGTEWDDDRLVHIEPHADVP